jgi:O-antigen/teichoic acid export membrane protein
VLRLLRYGVRLCGVDILGTLAGFIDQIVIVALLPASMVGIYAVALSSARVLAVVQGGINTVLFPSVAARETAAIVRTVATAFRLGTLLIAGLAVILQLVGPPLLLLAYGAKFAPAILPFRVLLLAVVMENGARILYQIYSGGGRPELLTGFESAAVTVLLLVMLALMPSLGTLGAAIAVLCAAGFRLAIAVGALPLVMRIERPRLVFSAMDFRMLRAILSRAPAVQATRP